MSLRDGKWTAFNQHLSNQLMPQSRRKFQITPHQSRELHVLYVSLLDMNKHFYFLLNGLNLSLSYDRGHKEYTWIDWPAVTYGWLLYITLHCPTLWLQENSFFRPLSLIFKSRAKPTDAQST